MTNAPSSGNLDDNMPRQPRLRFPGFEGAWNSHKFSSVFSFLQNNTLSRADLGVDGEVLNIHYGDVLIKYGSILDATDNAIPHIISGHESKNFGYLQDGDIVIADTAEDEAVGKAIELLNVSDRKIEAGLHTVPCRPIPPFASMYLGYYMNTPHFHKQLLPLMQGIKVLSISRGNISKTEISSPSTIAEQEKISRILYLLDQRAVAQKKTIAVLKKYKRGLLQNMFPRKGEKVPRLRFAGFTGDWEQHKLGELLQALPFKPFLKEPEEGGKYEVIQQGNEPIAGFANGTPCNEYKDIVIFGDHTLSLYKPKRPFFVATDGVRIIKGRQNIDGYYLLSLLERYKPQNEGYKRYYSILAGAECFTTYNTNEQKRIGDYFENLDNLIALHQHKCEILQKSKDGLLQQLFI